MPLLRVLGTLTLLLGVKLAFADKPGVGEVRLRARGANNFSVTKGEGVRMSTERTGRLIERRYATADGKIVAWTRRSAVGTTFVAPGRRIDFKTHGNGQASLVLDYTELTGHSVAEGVKRTNEELRSRKLPLPQLR